MSHNWVTHTQHINLNPIIIAITAENDHQPHIISHHHTITPSHHPIELRNQKLNHNLLHQRYYYLSWASTYKLHTTTNLPNSSHPHKALPTHSIRALPHRPNINARNYFCAWKSTNHDFRWHWTSLGNTGETAMDSYNKMFDWQDWAARCSKIPPTPSSKLNWYSRDSFPRSHVRYNSVYTSWDESETKGPTTVIG